MTRRFQIDIRLQFFKEMYVELQQFVYNVECNCIGTL